MSYLLCCHGAEYDTVVKGWIAEDLGLRVETTIQKILRMFVSKPFSGLFCGGAITFSHQLNYCSDSHELEKEKGKKSRYLLTI